MKVIKYILIFSVLISFTSPGCSLFKKKGPYDNMTHEEIMKEQERLKKQLDSLKNVKYDKQLDSLKTRLDSSSRELDKTQEEIKKSQEELNKKTKTNK